MLNAAVVRMTKGAAASIILLLVAEPMGGNQEWIERYTGYTDKSVSQALAFLIEQGLVMKSGNRGEYRYRLATAEHQLPLPVEELEGPEPELTTEFTESTETKDENEVGKNFEEIESENLRLDPLASSGSLTKPVKSSDDIQLPLARSSGESEKFRLERLLDRHEVNNPARARLLAGSYAYDLVLGHLVTAANAGQAIWRIENGWQVPRERWQAWRQDHCPDCEQYRSGCTCEDELDDEDEENDSPEGVRSDSPAGVRGERTTPDEQNFDLL